MQGRSRILKLVRKIAFKGTVGRQRALEMGLHKEWPRIKGICSSAYKRTSAHRHDRQGTGECRGSHREFAQSQRGHEGVDDPQVEVVQQSQGTAFPDNTRR